MKKVYLVFTVQHFSYKQNWIDRLLFEKDEITKHYIARNAKYIYANTKDEAKEKYREHFYKEYRKAITYKDWCFTSDNTDIFHMSERRVREIKHEIEVFENFQSHYEEYRKNMLAEDFKEWWFDNGRCEYLP